MLGFSFLGCGSDGTLPDGHAQLLVKADRQPDGRGPNGDPSANADVTYAVEQRPGRIPGDLIPLAWSAAWAGRSSNVVRIVWTYGSCDGARYVAYVDESPTQVIIDLWNEPDGAAEQACAAVGYLGVTTVRLRAPLGDRPLRKHRVEPPL